MIAVTGNYVVVAFLRGLMESSWVQPYVFSSCSPQNVFVSLVCAVSSIYSTKSSG